MPFYKILNEKTLEQITPVSFQSLDMKERQHLQGLLKENISCIDSNLLVFSEEFCHWDDSNRRIDLLALDKEANLVVIELKRVEEGSHMELQALRYAAMVSSLGFENVVLEYEKFLRKTGQLSSEGIQYQAQEILMNFLDESSLENVQISNSPKIILIAPSFSKEITTTVLWLNDRGLSIKCIEARPYLIDGVPYLHLEQVLPLPEADDYIVKIRQKNEKSERITSIRKRGKSTLSILNENGVLSPGDKLLLVKLPKHGLQKIPPEAKLATFIDGNQVKWEYDQQLYSLSPLCKKICDVFAPEVLENQINPQFAGPDYWSLETNPTTTLSLLAKQVDL